MRKKNYPTWIDDYITSSFKAVKNEVPVRWGPINFIDLSKYYQDYFIHKLHLAITQIKLKKIPFSTVGLTFSNPSTLRAAISFLPGEYIQTKKRNKKEFKQVMEFLVDVLKTITHRDLFAISSNIFHTQPQLNKLMKSNSWQPANPFIAKQIARLNVAVSSLVFSLYGDFFPHESNDVYGPYDLSSLGFSHSTLIIRHFSTLQPYEIWPQSKNYKCKDIKVYLVYRDIQYDISFVGMHSISKGDLINQLAYYNIEIDGKKVDVNKQFEKLITYFSKITMKQSSLLDQLSSENLKIKSLEWEGYQFRGLFKLANMSWKPEHELIHKVQGKKVSEYYELTTAPTYTAIANDYNSEGFLLKDLYK